MSRHVHQRRAARAVCSRNGVLSRIGRPWTRGAGLALGIAALVLALASTTQAALTAGSAEPTGALASPSGSSRPGVAPPGQDVSQEDATQGNLGRPYSLPAAPRSRMHECGIEWQKMKMSGAAEDKTWRVFASVCLTIKRETENTVGSKPDGVGKDR